MSDATAKLAEALREVMADADGYEKRSGKKLVGDWPNKAREALAAYEQAQAEPVAWGMRDKTTGLILDVICPATHDELEGDYTIPLFAAPVAQAEPVAWVDERAIAWLEGRRPSANITTILQAAKSMERPMPLYATPVAQAEQWQPIETAPKDGSIIMLLEKYESEPFFGFWWEGRDRWRASTTHYDTDGNACVIDRIYSDGVTHWMPLPQPPKENQP